MPKELAMLPIGSNEFKAVRFIDGLTESTVNKVIENIHVQSSQLTQIRKFYDDFQAFSHLNFEINTYLNEIKSSDRQCDFQKLSDMLNRYTYSFYEFVTFSEIYAKEQDEKILFDNLIAYQYSSFYEYRVAYYLGNFVKHVSQFIPLKSFYDSDVYRISISNVNVLKIDTEATVKAKNVFKEKQEVDLLDYLDTTYDCIEIQMRCFIKHILIDEKACDYFKTTYPFIEKYGFPAYIDSTNPEHIKISKPNDNVLDLQIHVARITNELELTHFNIIEENT